MGKLTKLFILTTAIFTLAGCGKVPVLENGQEAVVTTKNGSISADELYTELKESYGSGILIDLIDKIILNAKYEETDDEKTYIDEQIEALKESATANGVTYEYLLSYYGFEDEDAIKEYFSLNYRREQAVKEYVSDSLKDKEIEKYYEDNIYGDIKAKHILIEVESLDGMTSEEKEDAKKKALNEAKDIIKKLKNGEKFDDLAKKYSDDSSNSEKGGDLGWFNTGEMVETFEKAAFALKKGKYTTTPVETEFGYHIIYKTDEKAKPELKDVKEDIINTLVEQKLSEDSTLFYKALDEVRKENELSIEDSFLKDAYNDLIKQQTTSTK